MRELLKQYSNIKIEIKELEIRIKKLETIKINIQHDSVKGSSSYFPYEARTFSIEGYNFEESDKREERLLRLNRLLCKRKASCEDLKVHIEEFISEIPDSLTRRVFQYRYIDGLTWLQIAIKIEKYDESYPRKIIHDKYMEGLE